MKPHSVNVVDDIVTVQCKELNVTLVSLDILGKPDMTVKYFISRLSPDFAFMKFCGNT